MQGIPSLAHAQRPSDARYLPDGEWNHVLDIEGIKLIEKQPTRELKCVFELSVVESDHPNVRAGDVYSWVRPFQDQWGYGPGELKELISIVVGHMSGQDDVPWDDGFVAWIAANVGQTDHPQPSKGVRLHCETYEKSRGPKSAKAGQPITKERWRVLNTGETLRLVPQASTQPQSTPAPTFGIPAMPSAQAPAQPQVPAMPQAPVVAVPVPGPAQPPAMPQPQVASQPPPGWPPGMPWPGAAA